MTSLYDEVQAAPGEGVPTRRVTIKVNGADRTVDVEPPAFNFQWYWITHVLINLVVNFQTLLFWI
jgi:hypothetical protein